MNKASTTSLKLDDHHHAIVELCKEVHVRQGKPSPAMSSIIKEALMEYAKLQGVDQEAIEKREAEIAERRKDERLVTRIPPQYARVIEEVKDLERYQELCATGKGFFLISDNANIPNRVHPAAEDPHHSDRTFFEKVIKNEGKNGQYYFSETLEALVEWYGAVPCKMCSK